MYARHVPPHFSYTVSALVGAPTVFSVGRIGQNISGADFQDGGAYKVQGTVAIDSTPDMPVRRKVRLFCLASGRLVRETWSDPVTGSYLFEYIRQGPWLVVAHDYTGSYNAVPADNILGEPM